jgi:hypothetical protein
LIEKRNWLFSFDPSIIIEKKSTEEELPQNEVKEEGLISCDAITNSTRQFILKFITESLEFIKADRSVGFYEIVENRNDAFARRIRLQLILFSKDIGAF